MATRKFFGAILLLMGFVVVPCAAGDVFEHIARETKRRQWWPRPFNEADREAARTPFALMVANGWQRQNMIGDIFFNAENGELTEAGRLKVEWILYEAPEQHRTIYVHRGKTAEETGQRVETVRQYVALIGDEQHTAPVMPTDIADRGWPASRVDQVNRKFQASQPDPKLPPPQPLGGSGSSP